MPTSQPIERHDEGEQRDDLERPAPAGAPAAARPPRRSPRRAEALEDVANGDLARLVFLPEGRLDVLADLGHELRAARPLQVRRGGVEAPQVVVDERAVSVCLALMAFPSPRIVSTESRNLAHSPLKSARADRPASVSSVVPPGGPGSDSRQNVVTSWSLRGESAVGRSCLHSSTRPSTAERSSDRARSRSARRRAGARARSTRPCRA